MPELTVVGKIERFEISHQHMLGPPGLGSMPTNDRSCPR